MPMPRGKRPPTCLSRSGRWSRRSRQQSRKLRREAFVPKARINCASRCPWRARARGPSNGEPWPWFLHAERAPLRIDSVDFFYLAMPVVTTEADGSQDALLVRVSAGGHVGWGECEAAPLPSIAAFVCPMSHGVCRPVGAAILGQTLAGPTDIARMSTQVAYDSMDLLQAAHTLSGVEMAMWDLLGRARQEPVWKLLGYSASHPKVPYASRLFGDSPHQTLEAAKLSRAEGFKAAKFGWGPIGRGTAQDDTEHFAAAREGLGEDGILLVDVGQIFVEDVA